MTDFKQNKPSGAFSMAQDLRDTDIAIIALSGRFPGAADPEALWDLLLQGREGISRFTPAEMLEAGVTPAEIARPGHVPAGGVLDDVAGFDAGFFGFTPAEATLLDPQQRLFLECAWEALERAGIDPADYDGRIGTYAGAGNPVYLWENLLPNPAVRAVQGRYALTLATDKDMLAVRTAYKLGLRGPAVGVQTACSTSLVAVHLACQALIAGECDMALAGGVSLGVLAKRGYLYEEGMILSPDGHCRAFDAEAAGTVPASGVALLLLARATEALERGDPILGIIRGSAINNDGRRKIGFTAPSSDGQAEVVRDALAVAGLEPSDIGLVEAHGTGTGLGDPVEIAGLAEIFATVPGPVALGALKANLGHLDSAAGAAGLIKAVLALNHATIPPHPALTLPNPKLGLEKTPFRLSATPQPWHGPRRAGVSAFGIGGTNAHVVVEAAPAPASLPPTPGPFILPLSARSPAGLSTLARALADRLEGPDAPALGDVAFTLAKGRRSWPCRHAMVVRDREQAVARLRGSIPPTAPVPGARPFFLFPGQGSQYPGQGRELYATEPTYRAAIDRVADLLLPGLGFDIRPLMLPPVGEEAAVEPGLRETVATQAALFATGWALAQLWAEKGMQPVGLIGHSIGELVAATLAGVWSLEEAAGIVAARARAMQDCPRGAMLSVPLALDELRPLLPPGVEPAVIEKARTVVGGSELAISTLATTLEAQGVTALRLRTSHAFHTAAMGPAAAALTRHVAGVPLRVPTLPFISNLTGDWITAEQATDPAYWGRQLLSPVCLSTGLEKLMAEPGAVLLELGPGLSLGNAARQLGPNPPPLVASLPGARDGGDASIALLEGLGRLWSLGVVPAAALVGAGRRIPLPTTPFDRIRCWIDAVPEAKAVKPARDRFQVPIWRPAPLPTAGETGSLLLLADPGALGDDLTAGLAAAGWQIQRVVERGADALAAALKARAWDVVLFGWGLEQPASGDSAGLDRLSLLLQVGATLAETGVAGRLIVSTRGAASIGAERVTNPADAALFGAARVLSVEIPGLAARCVDLAGDPAAIVHALVREVAALEPGEVAWRGGRRWLHAFEPINLEPPAAMSAPTTVLITGGLGWIGRTLGAALAQQGARLALVGRDGLPPRADWAALLANPATDRMLRERLEAVQALEATGAAIRVLQADVADANELWHAIDSVEAEWGPVDAVIHAAGSAEGGLVHGLDAAGLSRVLAPKVAGLRNLMARLGDNRLRWLVLCSSQNAQMPVAGQFAYAAANAWLDAAADWLAGQGVPAISIGWDAWAGGGMAVETRRRLGLGPAKGSAIKAAEGVDALFRLLDRGLSHVLVSAEGEAEAAHAAPPPAPPVSTARPATLGPLVPPEGETEEALAAIWADVLGLPVGRTDRLFDMGGDSLVAITLLSRVRERLGRSVPLARFFDDPTVAGMARALPAETTPEATDAPIPRPDRLPLSSAQARLLFLDRLQGGSAEYNLPNAFELTGPLDADALEAALRAVQQRHEVLRTRILLVDGEPCQVIDPDATLSLTRISWEDVPSAEWPEKRDALLREAARIHFDFAREAPYRASLIRLAPDRHILLLILHHIAFDGWSSGVLVREIGQAYRRALDPSLPAPCPLPLQVADHALRERARLAGAAAEERRRWWQERLSRPPEPLALPLGTADQAALTAGFDGGIHITDLPPALAAAVARLGHTHGCTPYMIYLAAFALLLRRGSGQGDMVIGTPVANRPDSDMAGLIGFFVNTLALRLDVSGEVGFRDLLARVRSEVLESFARQDIPFDQVVSAARPEGDLGANPLFDVLFDWQNAPRSGWDLPGVAVRAVPKPHVVGRFQLSLTLEERDGGLMTRWEYDTARAGADAVARMAGRFQALLEAIVAAPDAAVSRLPWLPPAEQAAVAAFGEPEVLAGEGCLISRFLAQATRTPDAVAVQDRYSRFTYAELSARAARIHATLQGQAIRPGDVVALLCERSFEQIASLIGILGCGATLLPLDPKHPPERTALMLADSGARLVLARPGLAETLPPGTRWIDLGIPSAAELPLLPVADAEMPAYLLYTSGSTGQPKGVEVPHRAVGHFVTAATRRYGVTSSDRVLQFAALTFDAAVEEIWPTLCAGATLVLRDEEMLLGGDRFWRTCRQWGITLLDLPTAFWHFLCADLSRQDARPPESLRLVILGGERALPDALRRWALAFQGRERVPVLVNSYGPTETTVVATGHVVDLAADAADIPIGRPLPGVRAAVLDAAGQPVPPGVPGELYLGGPMLALGYRDRPDLTAERFVMLDGPDGPWRAYRTGDLVCWRSDGALLFRGRADRQLKIRGHRVEPSGIESLILAAGARAAAVDLRDGAAGPRLVAWVVPGPGAEDADGLRRALAATLPEAQLPTAWVFIPQLPLNVHGKVDFRALPAPEMEVATRHTPPQGPQEEQLAAIWAELLGVRSVGREDSFFALGGHSLLAFTLMARIEKAFGRSLPLASIFRSPTLAAQAALLRDHDRAQELLVSLSEGKGDTPLFLVHPGGASLLAYRDLMREWPADGPRVLGIEARGFEDGEAAHDDIAEMAACYLEALRTACPQGPVLLAGWCLGGVVAFEMSRLLRLEGREVRLVAMVESYRRRSTQVADTADFVARTLESAFAVTVELDDLISLDFEGQIAFAWERAVAADAIPADFTQVHMRRMLAAAYQHEHAAARYRPAHNPGGLTLIRARDDADNGMPDALGWDELANDVQVHWLPGRHLSLFHPPYVADLARLLARLAASAGAQPFPIRQPEPTEG
jgi:amino acid adenylation domain-containing protein